MDAVGANRQLWFPSDTVRILPFLVSYWEWPCFVHHADFNSCAVPSAGASSTWNQFLLKDTQVMSLFQLQICGYNIRGLRGEANWVALPQCPPLSIVKADSQWVHSLTNLLNDKGHTPVPERVSELAKMQ